MEEAFPPKTPSASVPHLEMASVVQEGSGMRKLSLFSSDGRGDSPTRTNTTMTPSLGASRPQPRGSSNVHTAATYGSLHTKAEKKGTTYVSYASHILLERSRSGVRQVPSGKLASKT